MRWGAVTAMCVGLLAGCTLDTQPRASGPELQPEDASVNPVTDPDPPGPTPPAPPPGPPTPGPFPSPSGMDAGPPAAPPNCNCDAGCTAPQCDPAMPMPKRENGQPCTSMDQCISGHCNQGLCCSGGTCCATVADCGPAGDGQAAVCDDTATCQGSRGEVRCETNRCMTLSGVDDDSACTTAIEADACGAYPSVYCKGGANQTAPACASGCTTDSECDDGAHCDGGACVPDLTDGSRCQEARQCESGYCQSGICCSGGDCCKDASACPDSYRTPPTCLMRSQCQGSRRDAVCTNHVCALGPAIDDDRACGRDLLANACGLGRDAYCNGRQDQSAPSCPVICLSDGQCDPGAYCGFLGCIPDQANGQACPHNQACVSGHCANGFCCAAGDCCQRSSDCPGRYGAPAQCSDVTTCQGFRMDPVCGNDNVCRMGTTAIPDDRACGGQLADRCGRFADLYCSNAAEQQPSCRTRCGEDAHCDPGLTCINGECMDPPAPDGGMGSP